MSLFDEIEEDNSNEQSSAFDYTLSAVVTNEMTIPELFQDYRR